MKKLKTATVLPPAPDIIVDRPEGMDYEEYRKLRKESNQKIKDRLKTGFMVHLSNEILFDERQPPRPIGLRYHRGISFEGSTKMLQVI